MMIDKKLIIEEILKNLNTELRAAEIAAHSSSDLAKHDDLKSEGKYDTRAIEASYLASAQLKRVEELKLDIKMIEDLELETKSKAELGALLFIEHQNQKRYYFLSSTSGGMLLLINENPILVISVFSPIGSEALGLTSGDSFEIETPKDRREYKIVDIY